MRPLLCCLRTQSAESLPRRAVVASVARRSTGLGRRRPSRATDGPSRRAAERAAAAAAATGCAPHRALAPARAFHPSWKPRQPRCSVDEIQQVVFGQLCNALDRSAVAFSSASGLREPMQRVGEGASSRHGAAEGGERGRNAGPQGGSAELQGARGLYQWFYKGLSATDLATLGKLIPVLPALETLWLAEESPPPRRRAAAGGGAGRGLPALTYVELGNVCVGDAGARRSRPPWTRRPAAAQAPLPARRRHRRRGSGGPRRLRGGGPRWSLPFIATHSAIRVSPPSWHRRRQMRRRRRLKRWRSSRGSTYTTPRSPTTAAHLASRLTTGALPAQGLYLDDIPASEAAIAAVYEARPGLSVGAGLG